jgi:NitT/TauT family transport system substrate-binding protein
VNAGLARSRFLAAAGAAGAGLRPRRSGAQASGRIRMGAIAVDGYALPYYAAEAGFFSRAGIDVEILPFANGALMAQAVAGGALDVGSADMIGIASAASHGLALAFFAGEYIYATDAPATLLCVARNGPIRTAKDLEGQTVAVPGLRSINEFAPREWLRANGADVAKVSFIELPLAAEVPAIVRGTVAAAMVVEPLLSMSSDEIRTLGKAYDACAKRFYINSFFAKRDWLAQNADLLRRLVPAIYDTARWANGHHAETLPMLAKVAKLEPERLRRMTRALYATDLDPRLMQPPLDIGTKYNVLDRSVPAAELIAKV